MTEEIHDGIAIVGMSGRFPGAESVDEFWDNLLAGKEGISRFSDEELIQSGLDPAELKRRGQYVPARGIVKDADCFDASFFGVLPKEAEVMDPQQRVFLELCWTALENAGYAPNQTPGVVGVFAGATANTYYMHAVHHRQDLKDLVGSDMVMCGNEKDYLTTRVAYKLGLRGPALNISTACSTSGVAVCQAFQSLITYQCDVALAGAVSITVPQKRGYFHSDGYIGSPDGHTRTFDEKAAGTVFGNGAGVVVLKRLEDAIKDGDQVYAVIKGAALNNDSSQRVSFVAPGVEGQAEVISMAQALAGFDPESISYVEAHGTATPLGDPIEIAALTKAFRQGTDKKQYCAIGSSKTNVGHLDVASGVTGLIKTALSLHHKVLPASLHFSKPNPKLDLENSPFFVNATKRAWTIDAGVPRRAGVSSFGLGGTNSHIVLEEAPEIAASGSSRPWQLFTLSAKTSEALDRATANLSEYLKNFAGSANQLADAAFTMQTGRGEFSHRRIVACQTAADGTAAIESRDAKRVFTHTQKIKNPPVVFMFPGQGAQYAGMGAELYRTEPVFRAEVDRCVALLKPILQTDLRSIMFAEKGSAAETENLLLQTRYTQPSLFTIEYALAKLWMSWGIQPAAMIGHSVGEYVAACLSGVFSLEDAVTLVAKRAAMVQALPGGAMLAVRLPEEEVTPLLNDQLSIGAINSPALCVIAGPHEAIAKLVEELSARRVAARPLNTSHAFHSQMMEPVLEPFTDLLRKVKFESPKIPYVSNVTARWVTSEDAMKPEYWAGHVRQTVRFAEGVRELMKDPAQILLEVGPGSTLSTLARQHPALPSGQTVLASLPIAGAQEGRGILETLGRLWMNGVSIDWQAFYANENRRRVPLPTYPFERKRYWPEGEVAAIPVPVSAVAKPVTVPVAAPVPAPVAITQEPRSVRILSSARTLLTELSGTDLSAVEPTKDFLELGLDSLLLTQAATLLQRKFGVSVTFRQLMEDLSSLDALTRYLDAKLPAEAFAPPAAAAIVAQPVTPAIVVPQADQQPAPATNVNLAGNSTLEQLLIQQMQLTNQVLQLLLKQNGNVVTVAPATPPIAAAEILPPASKLNAESVASAAAVTVDPTGTFPLTEAQREIWMAAQMNGDSSLAYNESLKLEFRGKFNLKAFGEALQKVVERHPIVTAKINAGGESQTILPGATIEPSFADLSGLNESERSAQLTSIIDEERSGLFDLANGPLLRVKIVRLTPEYHVVAWTAHHIVCDGWTGGLLIDELSKIYSALVQGKQPELNTPIAFKEYVGDNSPDSPAVVNAIDYWKGQFGDVPLPLELPTDRPRQAIRSAAASTVHREVGADLQQSLRRIAGQQRTTLVVLLMTALETLFYRLSNQSDIVIGLGAAGQAVSGKYCLAGHCVNLLPVRLRLQPQSSFQENLAAMKKQVMDGYDHHQCTIGGLLQHISVPRSPGRSPLVEIFFNVDRDLGEAKFAGLEFSWHRNAKRALHFDLFFNCLEGPNGLVLECDYNTSLFDADTVERWLSHYQTLLEGIASDSAVSLDRLPVLDEVEKKKLISGWNATDVSASGTQILHECFASQATKTPAAPAVTFAGKTLTYRELDQRSNQLAHHLRGLGVKPDTYVGLYVQRSVDMMVALLGILKAGGTYIPLDPAFPINRLAYMVEDSRMRFLVTHHGLEKNLPVTPESVIRLDAEVDVLAQQSTAALAPVGLTPENLAYVLYTSGSTGKPKGVQISHAAIVNFLRSMQQEPGFDATDTLLAVTTLSFDIAGLELYLPLVSGGQVVIADREETYDPARLMERMRESACTVMQATPATWRGLVDAGWQGVTAPGKLKILCGGEAMPRDLAQALLSRRTELWNMYGPTETTVWSTVHLITNSDSVLPIGHPIANTQVFVLDPNRNLVPQGAIGELYIGGTGLARGYLNRPELTAERFVDSPFEAGAKLYRTGDLARWLSTGALECLGRIDNQVKIRGYRIELGEIEAILAGHEAIRNCVVVAREDVPGDKQLVAYYETHSSLNPDAGELRSHLRKSLPEYMVPAAFMALPALPLTPNGKIDRKALPAPQLGAAEATTDHVSPRDALELMLAQLWTKVLRVKRVGLRDNFFELGGHSLAAARMLAEVATLTGKTVPLATLFQSATVEALAELLRQDGWKPSWTSLVPIEPKGSKPPLFLIHGAEGNVLIYRQLAQRLGNDQPVYGLQSQGLDGEGRCSESIQEMAAIYIKEIRTVQPHGPYFLGGYCLGGVIAFEMAQQLRAAGETVERVFLLESYNEGLVDRSRARLLAPLHFAQNVWFHGANLVSTGASGATKFLGEKIDVARTRIRIRIDAALHSLSGKKKDGRENLYPHLRIKTANDQAAFSYVPQPYDGRVSIIRPKTYFLGQNNPFFGWKEFVSGELDVHTLPLYPKGILVEPFCQMAAEELKKCMEPA